MNDNRHGILDIPDIAILSVTTLQELIDLYQHRLGAYPKAVCLPVTSKGGLTYDSILGLANVSPEVDGKKYDLAKVVGEAVQSNLEFYFMITPTLPFATTSSEYNLVDSVGDETPKCCVVNPFTQEAVKEIIRESFDLAQRMGVAPAGYVFVVQDLWPMGAKQMRLELTCFCRYCREALSQVEGLDLALLMRTPGPWNLALKDTGSGISHLNEIRKDDSPLEILRKSKEKGFYDPQWFSAPDEELLWARQLYLYIHARNDMTRDAVLNMKGAVPEGVKTVLMVDSFDYDWTSGMFFSTVREIECDEVWIPSRGARDIDMPNVAIYMVTRGRYLVDALFDFVSFIARTARLDPMASSTDMPDLRFNFVSRASKLLDALHFSRMEIIPVQQLGYNFVVPVITEGIVQRLMEQLGLQTAASIAELAQLAALIRRMLGEV